VLVKESLARIEATKDPNRDDVAKRHEENRHADARDGSQQHAISGMDERVSATYQQSRAVKERYLALQAKAEYEERIGKLVALDDVNRAFSAQWTQLRISMDHLRDQISAELSAESDQDLIHAMLGEHFERLQAELCQKLEAKLGVRHA